MTPSARVQAAIEILDTWQAGSDGLDRVLASWARGHRFAGGGDRRAIADLCYGAVRRLRSAAWLGGGQDCGPDGRSVMLGALRLDGVDPDTVFTGDRFAPAPLEAPERQAGRDLADAPRAVRLDYPDWLDPEFQQVADADLQALQSRAPVDLRVNGLKADVDGAQAALRSDGIETEPLSAAPCALRVTEGARKVAASGAYLDGLVEIQDAASQAAAAFAGVVPGMVVLDLCAGGGGKTLALGAAMQGQGTLLAHDIAAARMQDLSKRAARAGVRVQQVTGRGLDAWAGRCDMVVVDAPCSGSGAWRRNPDHKWRLTRNGLAELETVQAGLLDQAIGLCAPGGRIVYMTCSIMERENKAQVQAFAGRAPRWRVVDELVLGPAGGTDGFYAADLRRGGGS